MCYIFITLLRFILKEKEDVMSQLKVLEREDRTQRQKSLARMPVSLKLSLTPWLHCGNLSLCCSVLYTYRLEVASLVNCLCYVSSNVA